MFEFSADPPRVADEIGRTLTASGPRTVDIQIPARMYVNVKGTEQFLPRGRFRAEVHFSEWVRDSGPTLVITYQLFEPYRQYHKRLWSHGLDLRWRKRLQTGWTSTTRPYGDVYTLDEGMALLFTSQEPFKERFERIEVHNRAGREVITTSGHPGIGDMVERHYAVLAHRQWEEFKSNQARAADPGS